VDDRLEQLAIGALEALVVDLEQLERLGGDLGRDSPAWRTSATSRTRRRIRLATRGVPRERRAISSAASSAISTPRIRAERRRSRELGRLVVAEPEGHPEAVAQRRRQQAGARRRADSVNGGRSSVSVRAAGPGRRRCRAGSPRAPGRGSPRPPVERWISSMKRTSRARAR
jgi:hypothetical protein